MFAAILRTGLAVIIGGLAFGQTADKSLTFEAASVKPATPPAPDGRGMRIAGPNGGPGTKDPGRVRYPFSSLKSPDHEGVRVKALPGHRPGVAGQ